jgi:hypothetical protein
VVARVWGWVTAIIRYLPAAGVAGVYHR